LDICDVEKLIISKEVRAGRMKLMLENILFRMSVTCCGMLGKYVAIIFVVIVEMMVVREGMFRIERLNTKLGFSIARPPAIGGAGVVSVRHVISIVVCHRVALTSKLNPF